MKKPNGRYEAWAEGHFPMQHPGDSYNILDTETGTVQRLVMDEDAHFEAWYIQHNQEEEFTETLLGTFGTTKEAFAVLLQRSRAN